METLMLVKPSAQYMQQIMEYRAEFLACDEVMHGTASLRRFEDPTEWLLWLEQTSREETCPEELVPDTEFLSVRAADNRLVGMINIRHRLSDYLRRFGGHIGYSIRKSERGKGYGKEQLRLALAYCSTHGMPRVLITCGYENIASRKTILSAGGVYEGEELDPADGEITQRYWVTLA